MAVCLDNLLKKVIAAKKSKEAEREEEEEEKVPVVSVLRMMSVFEEKLGSLGPKVLFFLVIYFVVDAIQFSRYTVGPRFFDFLFPSCQ